MPATRSSGAIAGAFALALAACGGGGGGGDNITIAVDRTSLDFVSLDGDAAPEVVTFTVTSGSGSYYARVVVDRAGLLDASIYFGQASAVVTLTPTSPPLGTTSGNVTFQLCRDAACASVAWSKAIPYTIHAFSLGAASLDLSGIEGAASPPQALTITPADTGHVLTATTSTPWLTVARDASSAFQVTASAQGLQPADYTGAVVVAPAIGGPGKTIPVAFAVAGGIVRPPDAAVTLDLSGSLTGSIPVAFRGGLAPAWTATADKAWLGLVQGSGTGPATIQYAIDPARLDAVANWSSDFATVQIASSGLTTASMQLTVEKRLPEVYMVSPAAVPAGQAATVHVFGKGLSQIAPGGIAVSGAGGTSATVASDAEAVVAVPALAAGPTTVSVPNPFSIPTRSAGLAVAAAGGWTAAMVQETGEKRSALFDPLRNAVYAVNYGQSSVVRYRLESGTWNVSQVAVSSIGEAGMAGDLGTLYVTYGDALYGNGFMRTIDPDTFQLLPATWVISSSMDGAVASLIPGFLRTSGIQATNNGRIWLNGNSWANLVYFDTLAGRFARHTGPSVLTSVVDAPQFRATPDGSRMVVEQFQPTDPSYLYTSADDRVASPPVASIQVGATSRDGRVMAAGKDVYDTGTWTILGRANVSASGEMGTSLQISPDGSKAYLLVHSTSSSYPVLRIDVFDTASVAAGTPNLVKLGEIPVAGQAADCGSSPPYGCIFIPVFLVGPLGDVLFLVGNQGLVVVPVPPSLAGPP